MPPPARHLALLAAALTAVACGAEDRLAPYSAPPPDCPEADDYLRPLYALEAEGRLANLAGTIRHDIPDDSRRDLVDALLRLLGAFEDGDFSALAAPTADDDSDDSPGLQVTLGRVLRWLAETGPSAPNLPLIGFLRRAIATCDGAPLFSLLADAVSDAALVTALAETLGAEGLTEGLAGLDFEGANGRDAMAYLVRNLLVSAASPDFSVAAIIDLLDLLVDLDQPPFADLAAGLERLLDADGLPRLQGLLVCVGQADPDLTLGAFLYDLLTSGLVADALPDGAPTLSDAVRELAAKALTALATDAEARRAFSPALLAFLADDVAPAVLGDIADLLEAEALSGVFDLVVNLASGACARAH